MISRELCGNVMSTDGCGCLLSGLRFRELASGFAAGFSDAATARRTWNGMTVTVSMTAAIATHQQTTVRVEAAEAF
jgi:hypothetical protein